MSGGEYQQEAKSSVKISTTAAGKPLVEVKLYYGDEGITNLEDLRKRTVELYRQTSADLGVPA